MSTVTKTWDELAAERDRLAAAFNAKRIDRMHILHGITEGQKCGDCAHLADHHGDYAGHFFKCHKYGSTNSAASDWRLKWDACGLFAPRAAEAPEEERRG